MSKTSQSKYFNRLAPRVVMISTLSLLLSFFIAFLITNIFLLISAFISIVLISSYLILDTIKSLKNQINELASNIKEIDTLDQKEISEIECLHELNILKQAMVALKIKSDEQMSLLESQAKLTTIGEVSANISHEILNPLTIINTRVALLKSRVKKKNKPLEVEDFQGIENAVTKITSIANSIRKLARNESVEDFEVFNVEDIFTPIDFLTGEKLRESHITFNIDIKEKGLMLEGNDSLLTQVFLNLINNSRHAALEENEKWIKISVSSSIDDILIQVTDSGQGISSDLSKKLFKERITTKSLEEGTGLGLPLCKKIIDQHKGSIWIDDKAKNTTFIVKIPKYEKEHYHQKEVA